MKEQYEQNYPELKKEDRYSSPASPLPLHELKMLQEYIHNANLQNLGKVLPNSKQQIILLKFFKSKKNQLVEVYSKNGQEVIHTIGKVKVVGRDFVIVQTIFSRYWIPFLAIQSAKTPFGMPDVSATHQHVVYDEELRRKLLTNFGNTVASREELRQQFFDELLETNLKVWKGTNLTIYASSIMKGRIQDVCSGKVYLKNKQEIDIQKIRYIKQTRITSFIEKILKPFRLISSAKGFS